MLPLVLFMLAVLAVCVVLAVYVAYPHRGQRLPAVPWLGDAMRRGIDALPTIDDAEEQSEEMSGRR